MKLPPKDHFSIAELADRWHANIVDVQYYAVRGMLEVETWMCVPAERIKRYANNALAADFKGYAVVVPSELRRIFRGEKTNLRIVAEDLVVSRAERDRFERNHGMNCGPGDGPSTHEDTCRLPSRVASFPGRPSVMRRIVAEFEARQQTGRLEKSLQREGDALVEWAETNIPDVQIPTGRTIRNAIRDQYRQFALISKV